MSSCLKCGARLHQLQKFCNECGEKSPKFLICGPSYPPLPKGNKKPNKLDFSMSKSTKLTKINQNRVIFVLSLMLFLLLVGKDHSWHVTELSYENSDENFRGNFTDTIEVEIYHDLNGFREFQSNSRDYIGEENDTLDSTGTYYNSDSEWINQYDHKRSIGIKQIMSFLVSIAIMLTSVALTIITFNFHSQNSTHFVKKLTFASGIIIFLALTLFTLSFSPFEESDSSPSNEQEECVTNDEFIIGTFGLVELDNCEAESFESINAKFTPGLGFIEMLIFMGMSFVVSFAVKSQKT